MTDSCLTTASVTPFIALPTISVIVPTLNSDLYLERCLRSISTQDYPHDRIEVIVADGGSTDSTLAIAERYATRIIQNHLQTGEAGKAAGLKAATGEVIAFIDSDNILPQTDWFQKMVAPFQDAAIVGTEPIEFHYDRADAEITRYCAMLGMNDPICLFLGNYDRFSQISKRWTEINLDTRDCDGYTQVSLQGLNLPTIGANGTMYRKRILDNFLHQNYFFDIDIIAQLSSHDPISFAKVHVGIGHIFTTTWEGFTKKQHRRVTDYFYYSNKNHRNYEWRQSSRWRLAWFVFAAMTIVPTVVQGLVGYSRKPDPAWLCHPVACFITLAVYATATVRHVILGTHSPASRVEWR